MQRVRVEQDELGSYLYVEDSLALRVTSGGSSRLTIQIGKSRSPAYLSGARNKEEARAILNEIAYKLMSMAAML